MAGRTDESDSALRCVNSHPLYIENEIQILNLLNTACISLGIQKQGGARQTPPPPKIVASLLLSLFLPL